MSFIMHCPNISEGNGINKQCATYKISFCLNLTLPERQVIVHRFFSELKEFLDL